MTQQNCPSPSKDLMDAQDKVWNPLLDCSTLRTATSSLAALANFVAKNSNTGIRYRLLAIRVGQGLGLGLGLGLRLRVSARG